MPFPFLLYSSIRGQGCGLREAAFPGKFLRRRQQVQSSAAKVQKLPVEKPEIKELIDRYYEAPTIKEQLATGQDKIVIERNVLEEKVSVSGDKRTAFCLIEERVVDRKYLEHGNLTDMISEVRHGNIPTDRQLYLAVIDLMDLATFKVFRPLLARVKLESATCRMRQLTADFERKELEPSLQREDRNEFKLDRKIDDRSWFKTDHVVEKIAHKDVETSKQLEIVATNVTDLCTVELKKSSVDNKTLTEQIEQLQKANEESANSYKNEINNLKISYEVEKALSGAKAKNLTATKALLDMSNVKFDKEGNLTGLKEQIDNLVSNDETKFLFNTDNANIFTPRGFVPGKADDSIRLNADVDTSSMSYAQLCSYYENNPNAD